MRQLILFILLLISFSKVIAQQKSKANKLTIPKVIVVDKPVIEWISYTNDSSVVAQNIQTFSCVVKSRLPLQVIEIKTNGITSDVYNSDDMALAVGENNFEQKIEQTINLRTGINTILIYATNIKGINTVSSRRVIVDPNQIIVLRNQKDQTPPMIYISSPANLKEDRAQEYLEMSKITGTVIDESGIQSLKINNIVTPVKANGSFVINLPLNVGENSITIEALDLNQNIALKKFVIERKNMDGTSYKVEDAKNYLIIIGINSYDDWPMLLNAAQDAKDVKRVLSEQYKFDLENITILLDSAATRANINETLRNHIEKVSPNDNLLIYYSGHGYFDKLLNEGYWVPVDGIRKDVSSYIPNAQILKILENINSQHTFLVADACFSGSLFATSTRGYSDQVEKYKSRWGLASGRLEEVSDGQSGTNSPFAKSFIEFLSKNTQSKVAVSDLIQYVKKKVAEENIQAPIGNPLKGIGDEGGEFVFYKRQN